MLRTLSKRLERLENRILPNLAEQQTLIIDFMSFEGEVEIDVRRFGSVPAADTDNVRTFEESQISTIRRQFGAAEIESVSGGSSSPLSANNALYFSEVLGTETARKLSQRSN